MNEPFDALEAELAAWQPRPPTSQLQQRLRISATMRHQKPRRALLAAAGLAASLLFTLLMIPARPLAESTVAMGPTVHAETASESPSVLSYSRAFTHSSEALDVLLNRHAVQHQLSAQPSLDISTRSLSPHR